MLRALLYIPAHDPDMRKWMPILWRYCLDRSYHPEAVVHQWCDALTMVAQGLAQVIVVARRDHLDKDRMPRLEVVNEAPDADVESAPPGQRRVRRQR